MNIVNDLIRMDLEIEESGERKGWAELLIWAEMSLLFPLPVLLLEDEIFLVTTWTAVYARSIASVFSWNGKSSIKDNLVYRRRWFADFALTIFF